MVPNFSKMLENSRKGYHGITHRNLLKIGELRAGLALSTCHPKRTVMMNTNKVDSDK